MAKTCEELLLRQLRPILVCQGNVSRNIFIPAILNALIGIEIQFAFDDAPSVGVNGRKRLLPNCPSAISTVLGCVVFWTIGKELKVFGAGKLPGCALPFVGMLCAAGYEAFFCEVRHRISAADSDAIFLVNLGLSGSCFRCTRRCGCGGVVGRICC